jgi:hemin uptake protein HemP
MTPATQPAPLAKPASDAQVPSAALFQGRREIIIVHHGQEYRLRITRAGKLILTK